MQCLSRLLLNVTVVLSVGCASMCDSSLDGDYHAFGGVRDRHDRVNGRVGSLFDPAASFDAGLTTDEPQEPRPRPSIWPETDSGTDEDEESGLTDELMEELRKMEDLPEVPPVNGRPDDEGSPFEI